MWNNKGYFQALHTLSGPHLCVTSFIGLCIQMPLVRDLVTMCVSVLPMQSICPHVTFVHACVCVCVSVCELHVHSDCAPFSCSDCRLCHQDAAQDSVSLLCV